MSAKTPNKRWIAFNFDENITTKPIVKKAKCIDLSKGCGESVKVLQSKITTFSFVDKIEPKTVTDLAVHPKKIKEVECWLYDNLVEPKSKQSVPILLLTGPTGSGKTATVKLLCKALDIDIQEWVNPIDKDFEFNMGHGQSTRFLDFLLNAKFSSLFTKISNKKKVTVVEDFPNILLNKPDDFYDILESVVNNGRSSIIFICTDVKSNNLNIAKNIFTDAVREKFSICNISFNASSATLLKGALQRAQVIIKDNLEIFKLPSASIVDAIIETTMGDIRCALNQYYFASLKGCKELPTEFLKTVKEELGTKRKRASKKGTTIKSMGKDEQLGLFHSLGRVLNPKRIQNGDNWRLQADLQPLIDEFSTQPSIFSAFLHENYLNYFGDINDVCKSAEILSLSQMFLEKWTDSNGTLLFALWVSVMGLMVFNEHRVSKWNPIRGPKKVTKVVKNTKDITTRDLAIMDYSYYNLINKREEFHTFVYKCN